MTDAQKRDALVRLIEQEALDPVLEAAPDRYRTADERGKLAQLQRSTESEKRRFQHDYHTAKEVRDNYLSDLSSRTGKEKTRELEALGLPTLPSIKEAFLARCDELGVG